MGPEPLVDTQHHVRARPAPMTTKPPPSSAPSAASREVALGSSLDGIIIVVLFIGVRRFLGLPWAIGAATLWSLRSAIMRKRNGQPIGKFLPIITAAIVGRGIIGIVTDSEAVYFGMGIATKMLIGVVLIGSTLIGRNIVATYAPWVFGFDDATVAHPIYGTAMNRIAWIAGLYEIASGLFDIWLFNNASVDGYLVIRFIANWGASTVVLMGCFIYLNRALGRIPGFLGMMPLLENQMAAYEDAAKSRLASARSSSDATTSPDSTAELPSETLDGHDKEDPA